MFAVKHTFAIDHDGGEGEVGDDGYKCERRKNNAKDMVRPHSFLVQGCPISLQ